MLGSTCYRKESHTRNDLSTPLRNKNICVMPTAWLPSRRKQVAFSTRFRRKCKFKPTTNNRVASRCGWENAVTRKFPNAYNSDWNFPRTNDTLDSSEICSFSIQCHRSTKVVWTSYWFSLLHFRRIQTGNESYHANAFEFSREETVTRNSLRVKMSNRFRLLRCALVRVGTASILGSFPDQRG